MVIEQKIDGKWATVSVSKGDVFQDINTKSFFVVKNDLGLNSKYIQLLSRISDRFVEVTVDIFVKNFRKDFALTNANKCAKIITNKEECLDNIEDDFDSITSSICEMLKEKDKRYGNAALKPLEIFAKHHKYGARIDEKLMRVKNGEELLKNDVADIIGGLILICKDRGWTDFSDQID